MRQHAHLDFAGDAQFAGDLFLHRVAVSLGLEQRPHARLHLQHLERLGEIIIRARLEAARLVLHFFERGKKHDRHLGGLRHLAQAAADFVAVQARHHDVEQHQIRRRARGDLQRHLAVEREAELVVRLQALDEDVEVGLGVVHESARGSRKVFHCEGCDQALNSVCLRLLLPTAPALGEGVTLHVLFELRPARRRKKRAQARRGWPR